MDSVHDMGGMAGAGPIEREEDEPVFHSAWEARVFAMNIAMGAHRKWNIDAGRFAREQMPPADYLASGYFEKWLFGLEKLCQEHGFVTSEELERRVAELKGEGGSC